MEYNKTVTVDEWDERTYNINITASSKTTSSSVETTGGVADVVINAIQLEHSIPKDCNVW